MSTPQLLEISFSVLGCAWLWTVWDYGRNGRYLAPLRWYVAYAPTTSLTPGVWDVQELNAYHLPAPSGERSQCAPTRSHPTPCKSPFRVSETWLHPRGIYPATVAGWEEFRDMHGAAVIRWLFESRFEDPAGRPVRLPYFTPTRISPRNKMGRLLHACRAPIPTSNAEAERLDPEELIGTECLVRVRLRRRSFWHPRGERFAEVCEVRPWEASELPGR